jgi:hypothetical protein
MLSVASAGQAYERAGVPWPGGQITYFNGAADQAWAVAQAVNAWNRSGARVRFVRTTEAHAQLRIVPFRSGKCYAGADATTGYVRGATIRVSRYHPTVTECGPYTTAIALTHELGHVLGLGHEPRTCATMNASGSFRGPTRCPQTKPWEWHCRLLQEDDVRGAVALYGGSVRPIGRQRGCELYRAIASPAQARATVDAVARTVALTFGRPSSPRIPAFLLRGQRGMESFLYARGRDACPGAPRNPHERHGWQTAPGEVEQVVERLPAAGRYCYAVWAYDEYGRPSARASTAWLDAT